MDLFDDLPLPKNEGQINSGVKRELEVEDDKKECESGESKKLCSKAANETAKDEPSNIQVKGFFAERQGERDSMQDRHVLIEDFTKHLKRIPNEIKNMSYFGVFDGHAGHRAADYCAKHLHVILAERLSKAIATNSYTLELIEKEIKRFFIESFKQCDEEFLKLAASNKPSWKDGTTATVILIINRTLYSANIGDSKAIIYGVKDDKDHIIELTCEHNAMVYEERCRIQKTGASLKDGRVLGVLEVTRSIGDGQFKAYGVTCVPDVRKCQLNSSYKYVMLACDGLWKTYSNEEAVDYVKTVVNGGKQKSEEKCDTDFYELCCNKIASDAVKKLTADNVTVMLISILCD